jgi:hypothetical protein
MPRSSITTPNGQHFSSISDLVRRRFAEGVSDTDIFQEALRYNPKWQFKWIDDIRKIDAKRAGRSTTPTAAPTTEISGDTFDFDTNSKFGIEFEVLFPRTLSSEQIADKLTRAGIETRTESYNHENRRHWKITTDGSLHGDSSYYGMELVSPILKGANDLEEVKKVCKILTENGVKVNKSCGYHVHHESSDHNRNKTEKIAAISAVVYKKYQRKFNAMLPVSRRNNQYARSFTENEIQELKNGCNSIGSRYKVVNVQAYFRHGTVEFRQHSGTIDAEKAASWIKLTQAVVNKAREINKSRDDAWTMKYGTMENELKLSPSICKFIGDRVEHFRRREMGESPRLRENVA